MGVYLKKSAIYILSLVAITISLSTGMAYGDTKALTDKDQIKESGKPPEWVFRGFWKNNQDFYVVGSYDGYFINERDAYFAALRELSVHINGYSTGLIREGQYSVEIVEITLNIELAQIIKCNSHMQDELIENLSSKLSINNKENNAYYSEFSETIDGVKTRYRLSSSRTENNKEESVELVYECSTKDLFETLKRIPIVDTYIHKKDGRVETFVLIKYPGEYLKGK